MSVKLRGFTLIELMIVVAIIAILAVITHPLYTSTMQKSRRTDGMNLLLDVQKKLNYFYYDKNTYTDKIADLYPAGTASYLSTEGYYAVTILPASPTCRVTECFVLQAKPQGSQVPDGILELTSTDVRRRDKNKNGSATDANENSWD